MERDASFIKYRSDIDGLRGLAVIAVMAFHTDLYGFSGGYVGVDVFFVISGYIITTLIASEVSSQEFSYFKFYKRRAARLLPALVITLSIVLAFGFFFYSTKSFDKLGKEVFFSSFGAANILFAQGSDYFTDSAAFQPLLHLWSLGVEEQFYLLWPILLLTFFRLPRAALIILALGMMIVLTTLSVLAADAADSRGYYLLQYRANELLIGALIALILYKKPCLVESERWRKSLSLTGLMLIALAVIYYDKNTVFPGYAALLPCLGVALIIAFPNSGPVTRALSSKWLVVVGLVSYPLYLYHQPLVAFSHFFRVELSPSLLFITIALSSFILAWATFRYIETPIRALARSASPRSFLAVGLLCSSIPVLAATGAIIAKTNGLPQRFSYLNPFALEVSTYHASSFHAHFERGADIAPNGKSGMLFVGDSVLQQYVMPISLALGYELDEIDTVTRGGCVLLKSVNFIDKYADISCNALRDELYDLDKKYDVVVISQSWDSYDESVTNFPSNLEGYEKWSGFISQTVEHFLQYSDKVMIIGSHPRVEGAESLQPSLHLNKETYLAGLKRLEVINMEQLMATNAFFDEVSINDRAVVLSPYDIFCPDQCILDNGGWSFFSDTQHITNSATEFVTGRIEDLLIFDKELEASLAE